MSQSDQQATPARDAPFRDAEAWLAQRGVSREPIVVAPDPPPPDAAPAPATAAASADVDPTPAAASADVELAPATPAAAARQTRASDARARLDDVVDQQLGGAVSDAMAYARRATAATPMAEGRLARKLRERDCPDVAVERTLALCRDEGLVDDIALARSFVAERRGDGHAPRRIRADLLRREVADEAIETALAGAEHEDHESAAFDVARRRAATVGHLTAEAAFRRIVGYLARRGYPEALARKVARRAVFADREPDRVGGHVRRSPADRRR